jgi:hypothetical protein
MYRFLAALVDVFHATLMVAWVVGFPLLFWRRWPLMTRIYAWYALVFVLVSQLSHLLLDECVFTTLARALRALGGAVETGRIPFSLRLVDYVAGIRPSTGSIVLLWETGMALSGIALLWHLHVSRRTHDDGRRRRLR